MMAPMTPTSRAALFAGDVSHDLTLSVSHVPAPDEKVHATTAFESPGGIAANAAVACALAGTKARLVVTLGDDLIGRTLVEQIRARGVEVLAKTVEGSTCRVVVVLESHGEKRLLLHPGVSMFPGRSELAKLPLDDVGWVHMAAYNVATAGLLIERCRDRGVAWSLDLEPSTFPAGLERLSALISGAAVVFCNARAVAAIGGNAVERLLAMAARAIVETRGAEGAVLHHVGGHTSVAAPRAAVVDTTGAGDCLAGWFVAERLRGAAAEEALRTAVKAATMSCTKMGAQASYPTRRAVMSLATLAVDM
jgi:ribokinase